MLIPTTVMIVSDFRNRGIAVWSLFLFAVLSIGSALYAYGWEAVIYNMAYNIFLLFYLGIGIAIYLWFRNRRFTNPFEHYLGLGDLLFVLALTPLFGLTEFLIFLLASMIGGLVWWLVSGRYGTIPLVSIMGIALGIYMIFGVT